MDVKDQNSVRTSLTAANETVHKDFSDLGG